MAKDNNILVSVSVALPLDLIETLDERAEEDSRSRSNLIVVLLREALDAETPA